MRENQAIVYLWDDDPVRLNQVRAVTKELGFQFEAIADRLQVSATMSSPQCLIISDVAVARAEQSSGRMITDFHSFCTGGRVNLAGRGAATIVLCQQPEIKKIVRYMRAGALNVLSTPLDSECLSRCIVEAIQSDTLRVLEEERLEAIRRVYQSLSDRKRTVLQHIIDGRASKWSANELDMSRRTIELDRAEILNAFGVTNAIELATLVTETKCLPLRFSHRMAWEDQRVEIA